MNLHSIARNKRDNPHKILDEIVCRWSPRSMNGQGLTEEDLLSLFEAARWAPSAFNNQPWRFYYALRNSDRFNDLLGLLVEKNKQWCISAACLMIVVSKKTYDHNGSPMRSHVYDTGAAWMALAMEGLRRGYVVHGMAGFDDEAASEYLALGDEYQVNFMAAVGNPAPEVEAEAVSQRKEIDEIAIAL
ncbi:MAG: nitroreductase family protein [Phycisphaerae bacterium]|nr:nitroreductase family protein [Phycisphaerae bacterium]